MLEVRLLGSFQIQCGKKTVEIASRPAQSLFAYLILNAGTAFRREKLAGQLWPDSTEESARDYLRHALWRIRRSLEAASATGYLKANDLIIAFDASRDYWLDAAALSELDSKATVDEIAKAVDAYAGELLPGFYDEWVVPEREHLQAVYEQQMARLLDALEQRGQWAEALRRAEQWIALGQRPEAAYRHIMSAYAAEGDMAKAAAAYERCIKSLAELGVEPSEQTRQLFQEIKAGKIRAQSPAARAPASTAARPRSNLPTPLTSFIGREKELAEIMRLLKSQRLLTLVGPGGVGKTRLAIEASHRLSGKFKEGVRWIDLIGLSDPSLVPQAVAQATGVQDLAGKSTLESLMEELATRQSMLVIDNCEHLITACAQLVTALLSRCKGLRVLTTSREALDVLGEATWTVPSLSLPALTAGLTAEQLSATESGRLFAERVRTAQPGFELSDANAAAVAEICNRLSGIPLAIELAAARVKMMSAEEIARRLDHSFELLTGGNRAALPRHQTLRATIDWSYELLSEPERILFRRLAIFADGFTLEAVEAVTSDELIPQARIVELLGHLVGKSLVSMMAVPAESETRYRMLETIRQYAAERLEAAGEHLRLKERHLSFFAEFAMRAERGIYSAEQARWFARLDMEADNLRAALDWPAVAERRNTASIRKDMFTIISAPVMYWERAYRREIAQAGKRLLDMERSSEATVERARALYATGFLWWSLYDFALAKSLLEEGIQIAERLGDELTLSWALGYLGWTYDSLGQYDEATRYLERAVLLARSLGEKGNQAAISGMSLLGDIPYWRGDLVEARRQYEEAIAFMRPLHNINTLTYPLRRLGYVALREGNTEEAASCFAESLGYNQQLGHVPGMTACIAGFAAISLAKHNHAKAAMLGGCVQVLLERFGAPFFMVDKVEFELTVSELRKQMDPGEFLAAWAAGRNMQLDEAIGSTVNEGPLGELPAPGRKRERRNTQNTRSKHA